MSLSMSIMYPNGKMLVSGDSRACQYINGQFYKMHDNSEKLTIFDNMIVFSSGDEWLADKILNIFKSLKLKTVETFKKLVNEEVSTFAQENSEKIDRIFTRNGFSLIGFTVNLIKDGVPTIYNFEYSSNESRWDILQLEPNNEGSFKVNFSGIRSSEAAELYKSHKFEWLPITNVIRNIYGVLADERIGGTYTLYEISEGGIGKIVDEPIPDSKPIKEFDDTFGHTSCYNIKSINGDVMLDDRGMLQTWGDSQAENVGPLHKLKLKFHIPDDVISIKSIKLNFSLEKYRAYSTAAASGGGDTHTSENGGIHRHLMLEYVSTINDGVSVLKSGGGTVTVHRYNEPRRWFRAGDSSGGNGAQLGIESSGGSLQVYTKGDSGPHTHDVTIPDHDHPIEYGIYENASLVATGVKVYVDGIDKTSALGGGTGFTSDQANLDLTQWITEKDRWYTIELSSETLGRISAAYIVQLFLGA